MKFRQAVAVATLSVFAAGCINMDVNTNLEVSEDDTVSGNVEVLIYLDEEVWGDLAEEEGMSPDEADGEAQEMSEDIRFDESDLDELEELTSDFPTITVETVGDPEGPFDPSGFQFVFNNTPFDEFNEMFETFADEGDDFPVSYTLTRDGDNHVLEGEVVLEDDGMGFLTLNADTSVTFVGEVTDTNGDAEENVVSWDRDGRYTATADASASGLDLMLIVGGVILLVAVVGGGLVFARSRQ